MNLWTSSFNPSPTWEDSEVAVSTETPDDETDSEDTYCGQEVRPCSADRGGAQENANLEQALASVDAGSRVRTAGENVQEFLLLLR